MLDRVGSSIASVAKSAKKRFTASADPDSERLAVPAPSDTAQMTASPAEVLTIMQPPASWHGEPILSCEVPMTDA
jgi:hypothetical protein